MNKFIRVAIIVAFIQIITWCVCWGCLNPDIVRESWFGISKETITGNTTMVFWVCFACSLFSTVVIVGAAVHFWIDSICDTVKKLEENNKNKEKDPVVPDMK